MMDFKDEYINKSEAILAVTQDGCTANVVGVLYHLRPAEVVPKSEVENLKLEYAGFQGAATQIIEGLKQSNTEVVREIFEEIEASLYYKMVNGEVTLMIRESDYHELKKKYTEDQK